MATTVRINSNDGLVFRLANYNSTYFVDDPTLLIQSTDFIGIKNAFEEITKLEIFKDNNLIASYSNFDTFNEISYIGSVFVEDEHKFADVMRVKLTRSTLVDQVERLDRQLNPIYDPDLMTLEEYKRYKVKQISDACQNDIFAGTQVVLTTGVETFTLKSEDQMDIANLYNTVIQAYGDVQELPYHSTHNLCKLYRYDDIIRIYIAAQACITQKTTAGNFAIQLARAATSKEELDDIYYGMEFPADLQAQLDAILASTQITIVMMAEKLGIDIIPNQGGEDPEEPDSEEPDSEETEPEETDEETED